MRPAIASLLLLLSASVSFADGHCGIPWSETEICPQLDYGPVDARQVAERELKTWSEFVEEQGGILIFLNQSQPLLNEAFE